MGKWFSLLMLCVFAESASPCLSDSSCQLGFQAFLLHLNSQCPPSTHICSSPIQVNGEAFDKAMASIQKNEYMAIMFYSSWCPFSSIFKHRFSTLSSIYPQIKHMMVEQSLATPSFFSRYGIHSVPSLLIVNQTIQIRHRGSKDLQSLISFYKRTTGLDAVVDIAEEMPCSESCIEPFQLLDGASTFLREPYLALSLAFVLLRAFLYMYPEIASDVVALWVACIPHLNLRIFGEWRRLGLQLIDVRRMWSKLKICKTRNFNEGARNAGVWEDLRSRCIL